MPTCPTCAEHFDQEGQCPNDGSTLVPDALAQAAMTTTLQAGDLVADYRVEKKIGQGAFGEVYRAEHALIGKRAAIKVLSKKLSSDVQMVSRFLTEARAVNQIRNRNIVDVFAFGALDDGRQYLVMELLEGEPLDDYLKTKGKLSLEEALPILEDVGEALDAAHEAGIVHRDLKPANIFLCRDRRGIQAKLLDFGIAKLTDSESTHHKTATGTPMGTPLYMSPEQCIGKGIDHRTDIYSFGVMAYRMLTGAAVFDGDTFGELMFAHMSEEPEAPSSVCDDLPECVDRALTHMMAKKPDDRPATLAEAIAMLREPASASASAPADLATNSADAPASSADGPSSEVSTEAPTRRSLEPPAQDQEEVPQADASSRSEPAAVAQTLEPASTTLAANTLANEATEAAETSSASEPSAASSSKRGGIAIAAIAAALAIAFVATRKNETTAPAAPAKTEAPQPKTEALQAKTTKTSATVQATVAATEQAKPAPAASAPPPEPESIQLTIRSIPKDCTVYRGTERLGSCSDKLSLAKGDTTVTLTLKKKGYRDKTIELKPAANQTLDASLVKVPASKAFRAHRDIPTPF
jgi:eukaryotic-like serine/threonine-protein kinase